MWFNLYLENEDIDIHSLISKKGIHLDTDYDLLWFNDKNKDFILDEFNVPEGKLEKINETIDRFFPEKENDEYFLEYYNKHYIYPKISNLDDNELRKYIYEFAKEEVVNTKEIDFTVYVYNLFEKGVKKGFKSLK